MKATAAQLAALRWLVAGDAARDVSGGSLIDYYWERAVRDGRPSRRSTDRLHAWRRNGGRVLAGLERAGLVRHVRFSHGVPFYDVTPAGLAAAESPERGLRA